jgi:TolB-like protein
VSLDSALRAMIGVTLMVALAACAASCGGTSAGFERLEESSEVQQVGNLVHSVPGFQRTPALDVHAVRSSKTVIIHKIAVMPLVDAPDKIEGQLAQGSAEAVTAELYARATIIGGWTVVTQDEVATALQQMPPTTLADMDQNALALGRKLGVDGVIYGSVQRYRERVGYDYAAQTPAAVAFTVKFVDEKSGQIVWTGNFAKEQKSLSENVLDLPTFISNSGRWVRAHDLAAQGGQEAVESLQDKLTVQPIVQGQY